MESYVQDEGFQSISRFIAKDAINNSNKTILDNVFSVGGRRSLSAVHAQLSSEQQKIYRYIVNNPECRFVTDYVVPSGQYSIAIGMLGSSAPILELVTDRVEQEYGIILGYFIPCGEINELIEATESIIYTRQSHKVIDDYFSMMSNSEAWRHVHEISQIHEHIAPVIYLYENKTITNFYLKVGSSRKGTEINLFDYLEELTSTPITDWSYENKEIIYSLVLIGLSGTQTRYEEFNNKQITVAALYEHLLSKYNAFCTLPKEFTFQRIEDLARELKKERTSRLKDSFVYRIIDGVTLNKQEVLAHKLNYTSFEFPQGLIDFFLRYDVNVENISDFQNACDELYRNSTGMAVSGQFSSIPELLTAKIVSSARKAVVSDASMCRGFRNLKGIIDKHSRREFQSIMDYKQANYFCFVDFSDEVLRHIKTTDLLRMTNAISARMNFNSWHYVPGNYDRKTIGDRDYYVPPVLSDIASHSDLHHPGHVHARVKYTIRSPAKIQILGHDYRAFVDLRLMRMQGEPYTENELRLANFYTELVRMSYQSLVNYVVETGVEINLTFATKAWYKKYYEDKERNINNET